MARQMTKVEVTDNQYRREGIEATEGQISTLWNDYLLIVNGPGELDMVFSLMRGTLVEFTVENIGRIQVEVLELRVATINSLAWNPIALDRARKGEGSGGARRFFDISVAPRDRRPRMIDPFSLQWKGDLNGTYDVKQRTGYLQLAYCGWII